LKLRYVQKENERQVTICKLNQDNEAEAKLTGNMLSNSREIATTRNTCLARYFSQTVNQMFQICARRVVLLTKQPD